MFFQLLTKKSFSLLPKSSQQLILDHRRAAGHCKRRASVVSLQR
jgi:hypothetical protein